MPRDIEVADSITKLGPEMHGAVLVAGSHGGRYCGYLAALGGLAGVILNDAGIGFERAGVGALDYLAALGVPAATVSHRSARIGDGEDMMERGVVSFANGPAEALGVSEGNRCDVAAERLRGGGYGDEVPAYEEARMPLPSNGPRAVVACDSASLIVADDADCIVITGSHGGILASRPDYGIAAPAYAAVFNDAGVGIDDAGLRRLSVLEAAGIIGVTVDAFSARIGDARSAWDSGLVSFMNERANKAGITVGMTLPEMVARINYQSGR
ncbi:MAG: hypothetical protein AAF493_06220 [Pseudomonadota bacterium]